MHKIKVELPFSVRMEGEAELLAFTPGVHEVAADVLGHWFVQSCIKDGRAMLTRSEVAPMLSEASSDSATSTLSRANARPAGPEEDTLATGPLTEEQLRAISNRELTKMAQGRGLTVPGNATKDMLVALLLEADLAQELGQEQE